MIPKVIREKYPELSEGEVEEVRQRVLLDMIVKGNDITDKEDGNLIDSTQTGTDDDKEKESEGNRLLKLTNRFINIDKLSINLIDTINPFQRAYEIVSKTVDAPTLKVIQNTLAEHEGKHPSLDDPNPKTRELAQALTMIKNLKIRKMMGLDYELDKK